MTAAQYTETREFWLKDSGEFIELRAHLIVCTGVHAATSLTWSHMAFFLLGNEFILETSPFLVPLRT